MKVQSVLLRNFKRFHEKELDFRDVETGLAKDLIVLVGNNGSGKSSILQAIAAIVGNATERLASPADLEWPGFDLRLAGEAWTRLPVIEIDIEFSQDEIQATCDYFAHTEMSRDPGKLPPGQSPVVKLCYNCDTARAEAPTAAEFFQFRGRVYARMILKYTSEGAQMFERVGDVFWYTEHRTTNSLTPVEENGQIITMSLLRQRMSELFFFHERVRRGEYKLHPGRRDPWPEIERAYQAIFPGHRFAGPVPRTEIGEILAEPWFYIFDGQREYELSEMSGGERAIFPMLFDFANWNIHNSIILIDELELHLHPPLQQNLIKALRNLGRNNQFIITTHSDAVITVVPEACIYRL